MRRKDREIKDRNEIDQIIQSTQICRLGLSDHGQPYVVPLNFGYDGKAVYFHSASSGRKLQILAQNRRVCLEFEGDYELLPANEACSFSAHYESVIAFGEAELLTEPDAKKHAYDIIMAHYAEPPFKYNPKSIENSVVIRVALDTVSGKRA